MHSSVPAVIDRATFAAALNEKGLHAACRTPDMRQKLRETRKRRAVFFVKSTAYRALKRLHIVK